MIRSPSTLPRCSVRLPSFLILVCTTFIFYLGLGSIGSRLSYLPHPRLSLEEGQGEGERWPEERQTQGEHKKAWPDERKNSQGAKKKLPEKRKTRPEEEMTHEPQKDKHWTEVEGEWKTVLFWDHWFGGNWSNR
ncbi:hypothetical protein Pmani_039214 [Petrolisthes manimaculis]|nr:hypothetical protein Pmani_039214 [Petrolisthes manimaculis]